MYAASWRYLSYFARASSGRAFLRRSPPHLLLGSKNLVSYKFALGRSLLEVAGRGETCVSLEELAEPYTRYPVEHFGWEICRQDNAIAGTAAVVTITVTAAKTTKMRFNFKTDPPCMSAF